MEGFKYVDKRVDKLAVVLTCTSAFHEFPKKVLNVCGICSNSAEDYFQATVNVLEKELTNLKQLILGGVLDTTALNSRWKKRVMVKLEKYIGQKLVHVYCRHHVFERICSDVVATVVGNTKAPEHNVYQDLTALWPSVTTCDFTPFDSHSLPTCIQPIAQEFVTFARAITKEDKDGLLLKDDYRELIRLGLLLLNSFPKDASQQKVRSIGCVSNSSWMAKVICEQKIALYSAQLLQLKMIK